MALTLAFKLPNGQPDTVGAFTLVQVADITFDSSYATGGEALTAGDLKFPPGYVVSLLVAQPSSGFNFEYDQANSKLKVRAPGIAFGAAGALTIDDFPLSGTGATSASIGLNSAATSPVVFGPQQEIANGISLASITTRVFAVATATV